MNTKKIYGPGTENSSKIEYKIPNWAEELIKYTHEEQAKNEKQRKIDFSIFNLRMDF